MLATGPNLALWLPCLLLAHAIAIFWLLNTQFLAKRGELKRSAKAHNGQEDVETKQPLGNCLQQCLTDAQFASSTSFGWFEART
jgi:hypothetical protein